MKPQTVGRVMTGLSPQEHAQKMCHGLPVGLPILTADGALPVEFLTAGDRIVTRNGGLVRLECVESETVATRGIRFDPGSFAGSDQKDSVVLPQDQPVLVRDHRAQRLMGQNQAMVLAQHLVDNEMIVDIGPRRMTLFRLEFDRPRVVYAGGLELSSIPTVAFHRQRPAA